MRCVLVTGAAGFVGRHVVAAIVRRGWRVLSLDCNPAPSPAEGVHIQHHASAADPVPDLPETPDAAILLAWPIVPGEYLGSLENMAAMASTVATAQRLLELGCRHLVAAGTSAEYAPANEVPIPEDHPLAPDSLYAACKAAAHLVVSQLCRQHNAKLVWARIFSPYGPGEPPGRLLPTIARYAKQSSVFAAGSGQQVRDYVHVADVGAAFALLAEETAPDGPINVCTGVPISLAEVMRLMTHACGGRDHLVALGAKPDRAWDPPYLVGNPGRLIAAGWRPRHPRDGLAEYGRLLASG